MNWIEVIMRDGSLIVCLMLIPGLWIIAHVDLWVKGIRKRLDDLDSRIREIEDRHSDLDYQRYLEECEKNGVFPDEG